MLSALILLVTAFVGLWVAYDRGVASQRFALIAFGIVATLAIVWAGRRNRERVAITFCLVCAVLAAAVGAFTMVSQYLTSDNANMLHENAAGGALAITVPFGMAGLYDAWRRGHQISAIIMAAAMLPAVIGLGLTGSRGAWIGLVMGGWAAVLLHRRSLSPRAAWLGIVATALVFVVGFRTVVGVSEVERLVHAVGADASTQGRVVVWRDMLTLVQDYPFTGSGLGVTSMVYSTYVLLIHVPFLYHAHNLFLQIAVEQGLLGLGAFVGLLGISAVTVLTYEGRQQTWFRAATLASLITLAIPGMFDAELYVSGLMPLTFLPIAGSLILAADRRSAVTDLPVPLQRRKIFVAPALISVFALGLVLLPPVRAALHANLGAVTQTRTELAVYRWPEWPIQDAVRRSHNAELQPAVARYGAALVINPQNATANRRLGQIALSMGNYEKACSHLEAAYEAAPHGRATRQMLGECYGLSGDGDRAVELWQSVDTMQGQLKLRRWWYNEVGSSRMLSRVDEVIARVTE